MAEHRPLTRRDLFRLAAASGVTAAVGSHVDQGGPRTAAAQPPPPGTPEEALKALSAGNERYAKKPGTMTMLKADMPAIRRRTTGAQYPFAAVLACADSRVPPEIAFDQTIGQLFVVRVAGNIVTPDAMASLEYAAHVLTNKPNGEPTVKVIVVLGHGNCGAVSAASNVSAVPGQISALYPPIRAAIGQSTGDAAIKVNARAQAALMAASAPVIRDRVMKDRNLQVVAWYYDVATGVVSEA
jgi:carbonic anhydrase